MKYVSVISHTSSEWLGHIEDHFEGRGIRFGYHRPFTSGGALPSVETLGDAMILLGGGPFGAASPDAILPTLDLEVRLARACLMLEKTVIGFGLGSQILAIAAEGRAEPAPLTFAVETATRTRDDALAGFLPEHYPSVSYMRDRPVPPDYADVLARDSAGQPALYQIGKNAFGFWGNPGLRPAMIEDLIMEFDDTPENTGDGLAALVKVSSEIEDALVPIMTGLIKLTGLMEV